MVSAAQADLFRKSSEPEGIRYRTGVVAPAEGQRLASQIADLLLKEFLFQGFVAKLRVMSFGRRYDFERARFEQSDEIPGFLLDPIAGLAVDALVHALVTVYASGAQIGWHKDRPVFEDVIGVSLLWACTFRFRRKHGTKWERYSLQAEPRSIYLMRLPSRWEWEHSIPDVKRLRSVTFRSLRAGTGSRA